MQVAKARDVGVNSAVLFPKVPDAFKVVILLLSFFLTIILLVFPFFFSFFFFLSNDQVIALFFTYFFVSRLPQVMKHTMTMV